MTSNSKHESLTACEYLRSTNETVSTDTTRCKIRLTQGYGMKVAVLFACDLAKKQVTPAHLGQNKCRPSL